MARKTDPAVKAFEQEFPLFRNRIIRPLTSAERGYVEKHERRLFNLNHKAKTYDAKEDTLAAFLAGWNAAAAAMKKKNPVKPKNRTMYGVFGDDAEDNSTFNLGKNIRLWWSRSKSACQNKARQYRRCGWVNVRVRKCEVHDE